jgi:hypothetical protein
MDKETSWDALASALNVNRRTLLDLRFKPGAPAGRDQDEWRAFLASRGSSKPTTGGTDLLPGSCSYDAAVAAGQISYADAKIREAVVGEQIANDTKRGLLVTKEAVKERVQKITAAYLAALAELPDIYANTLSADQRGAGRKMAREWVDQIREKFAGGIRSTTSDG